MYGDCSCSSMKCILLVLCNKNANIWAPVGIRSARVISYRIYCFSSFPGMKTGLFRSTWCLLKSGSLRVTIISVEVDFELRALAMCALTKIPVFLPSILQVTGNCTKGFVRLLRETIWEKSHSWRNLCFPLSWPVGRFFANVTSHQLFSALVGRLTWGLWISYWAPWSLKRENQEFLF